ncbi:MAG TPA: response regulator [Chitinolyticbacter sp.]|nr:response regulator [Chitinolyticbacter sp.]
MTTYQAVSTDNKEVCVMLIEDSPVIRDALKDALSGISYIRFAATAATADEAIAWLKSTHFDLLVIDLELREGTGFDVLHFLRDQARQTPPPVRVVLTNHAYPVYEQRARALGVDYFYDKSMHFEEAIGTIETEAAKLHTAH